MKTRWIKDARAPPAYIKRLSQKLRAWLRDLERVQNFVWDGVSVL